MYKLLGYALPLASLTATPLVASNTINKHILIDCTSCLSHCYMLQAKMLYFLRSLADKRSSLQTCFFPLNLGAQWFRYILKGFDLVSVMQISCAAGVIPYVLLIYEAEEFCNLVMSGTLMDQVSRVQNHYPNHTICYLMNRLMAYINKRLAAILCSWCLLFSRGFDELLSPDLLSHRLFLYLMALFSMSNFLLAIFVIEYYGDHWRYGNMCVDVLTLILVRLWEERS